jgi:cell division protease FtsH
LTVANDKQPRKGRWTGFDTGGGGTPDGSRRMRFSLWWIAILLLGLFLLRPLFSSPSNPIDYSEFLRRVERGEITQVGVAETYVEGEASQGGDEVVYTATRPPGDDGGELERFLKEQNVDYDGIQPSGLANFIYTLLPTFLIIGLLYFFLFRRMSGGAAAALNLGRNKVRIYDRKEMKTTFSDVAGLDEPVQELREIVDFLKTLLARAVAGEANVPFFFMSGSEFVEMFVGLGAARVRELFNQAKEKAPALVFLDELDTIGKGRLGGMGGGFGSHDEREQTLNQLLVEMDGFDSQKGVIIMAATNRPDVLDPALVRPGRFDRQVVVDRPDLRGREAILKVHARGVALDPSVDLTIIASRTPGFTGADLANVVNEAALLAARREKNSVTGIELEEAIDRVVAGLERKSRVMTEKDREIVAVHEMGHALVALDVPTGDPVHRVSIIPRGAAALGMTMQRPLEDRYLLQEPELADRLAILLGGRTAEEITFGQVSTGAQNDLERATDIARAMVTEYGMSEKIGPVSFGRDGFRGREGAVLFPGQRAEFSESTARVVDEEVARYVNDAQQRAQGILSHRRDLLDRLSKLLMQSEVIEGEELTAYVEGTRDIPEHPLPPESTSPTEEPSPAGPGIIASPGE